MSRHRRKLRKPVWNSGTFKTQPDRFGNKVVAIILIFIATLILISIVFLAAAHAHDHKRPNLDQWFREQANGNGVSCCDGQEATRIANVDWQSACEEGKCHYQVFIDGRWWDVPEWAVVKGPNMDGETLVWPIYYWKDGKPENGLSSVFIRCFMPGAGG